MKTKRLLTLLLALVMCVALTLSLCACSESEKAADKTSDNQTATESETVDPLWKNATYTEDTTIGEGEKSINVTVKTDNKSIVITVRTDAKTLEQALIDVDLIQGEDSEYGLFIKTVNGIVADYDVDNTYWAIYKGGEYLLEGANKTSIADGDSFELVRSK